MVYLTVLLLLTLFEKKKRQNRQKEYKKTRNIKQMASLKPVNLHLLTLYLWSAPFIFQHLPGFGAMLDSLTNDLN